MATKSEKRIIRQKITELKGLFKPDELHNHVKLIQDRIDDIYDLFDLYKLALDSSIRAEFDDLIDRENEMINSVQEAQEQDVPGSIETITEFLFKTAGSLYALEKNAYVGVSGKLKLMVTLDANYIVLSRVYQGETKIAWTFNEQGRLNSIDAIEFYSNNIFNLIQITQPPQRDWKMAEGRYFKMPGCVHCLNPGFLSLPSTKQYESISRFGHKTALDLVNNLSKENIKDSYVIKYNQRQLREIVEDHEAMSMIRKTCQLMPFVFLEDYGLIRIGYK